MIKKTNNISLPLGIIIAYCLFGYFLLDSLWGVILFFNNYFLLPQSSKDSLLDRYSMAIDCIQMLFSPIVIYGLWRRHMWGKNLFLILIIFLVLSPWLAPFFDKSIKYDHVFLAIFTLTSLPFLIFAIWFYFSKNTATYFKDVN